MCAQYHSPMQELYSDEKYCISEINVSYEIFCNKRTTPTKYDLAMSMLVYIYIYAPTQDVKNFVTLILQEASIRKAFFEAFVWKNRVII